MNSPTEDSSFAHCHRKDSDMRRARSKTIPLPRSHVVRTQSELQLSEDMAAAEWMDLCMFYRVVGGIREQQKCSNGALIHEQHRTERLSPERKPITDWTGKDVSSTTDTAARVTPFETTEEASSPPSHQGKFLPYPQPLLLTPKRNSSDGGWSITGFEDDPQENNPLAVIDQAMCDDDDMAIFVMDL